MFRGFVIEGNGATIVNTDCYSGFFKFAESRRISISGLNFDYFFVPWVQAEVVSYDTDTNVLTLMTEGNYCVFDDSRYTDNIASVFGVIRDSEDPRRIDEERLFYFRISSVKKVTENGYSVTIGNETVAVGTKFKIGDKVTLNNRKDAGYSVFDIRTCGDVTLTDINAYSANGCLVLGQYMTGDVTLTNVNILFAEHEERWITSNSDGVHIQAGSGRLVMNNCKFEGLSDDGVNLYQGAAVISEIISDNTLIIDGTAFGVRVVQNVGDTLIFYDINTGEPLGEAKVTEIETVEGASVLTKRKVTIDQKIDGIIIGSDRAFATHVYIKDQAFYGTEITNCTFNNIRGRGLVLRANNCTVSGNTFTDISNHAIFVGNWTYEGTYTDGLKIVKNEITNCGYNHMEANSYRAASIGIYMENYGQSKQLAYAAHKNIYISDNTISNYHGRAIKMGNTAGAYITNNTMNADTEYHAYTQNETIYINESNDVTITGNKFNDAVDDMEGSIVYESGSTTGIQISDNIFEAPEEKQIIVK